jgi:hypothetical protein
MNKLMTVSDSSDPVVLDPRQLARIENVHRGFLYQHLYAAQCLLQAGESATLRVVVEHDEDIEIVRADERLYIQVKKRAEVLQPSDIGDAMERFSELREEHVSGKRKGKASFVIACNAPPSAKLARMRQADAWPQDVELHWPGGPDPESGLPRPAVDISGAFEDCVALADALPLALLRPDTLSWKLAGEVMLASAGAAPRENHAFSREELPALFEQLVVRMQDVPAPPLVYRAQIEEPALLSDERVRMLVGHSGAGKTAWVAEAAVHANTPVTYIDVADIPGTALPATVTREVAARMFGRSHGILGEILLPGASPLETLGALSGQMKSAGRHAHVVLDNAHALEPGHLRALVERAPSLRFFLIAQPGPAVAELTAILKIEPETLGGWEEDTVAAVLADAGCSADYSACERIARLTGALPFYVLNAGTLAAREYGGSVAALCADLERQTQTVELAQEVILRRAFDGLPEKEKEAVSVLSLSDVALVKDDVLAFLETALELSKREAAARLRAVPRSGMLELFGNEGVKVHDAVRLLGRAHLLDRGVNAEEAAQQALLEVMVRSIRRDWSIGKLSLLIRLFGALGQSRVLVQFATDELFHEMGVWPEIEPLMVAAANDEEQEPETRLWALDALVFNDLREGDVEAALPRLEIMKALLDEGGLGPREWLAWAMKNMLAMTESGDVEGVLVLADEVKGQLPDSEEHRRIFRYNRALALFKLGRHSLAADEVEPLIEEYYRVLGLTPDVVIGRNAPEIRRMLPKDRDLTDDLKHLADTLDLFAQARGRDGLTSGLARIHALKFYDLAQAPQSLVRVGQDLVDDFVARHDFIGAREVIERNIFPIIQGMGLVSWVVPVRAQYAVVLAYCGDHQAASVEMERLLPYEAGLSGPQREELRGQRRLVDHLRRFGGPTQFELTVPQPLKKLFDARRGVAALPRRKKIGRNETCPCGSERKYKHCHGR